MKLIRNLKPVLFVAISLTTTESLASSGAPAYGAILAGAKRHRNSQPQGYCDYSNAASNGGWGWNQATNSSCPPAHDQGYCDFSAADQNDGWGWNPVTGQSCR